MSFRDEFDEIKEQFKKARDRTPRETKFVMKEEAVKNALQNKARAAFKNEISRNVNDKRREIRKAVNMAGSAGKKTKYTGPYVMFGKKKKYDPEKLYQNDSFYNKSLYGRLQNAGDMKYEAESAWKVNSKKEKMLDAVDSGIKSGLGKATGQRIVDVKKNEYKPKEFKPEMKAKPIKGIMLPGTYGPNTEKYLKDEHEYYQQKEKREETNERKKRVEKARKLNKYKNRTNADRLLKK